MNLAIKRALWTVRWSSELVEDPEDLGGTCDPGLRLILLNTTLTSARAAQVLVHEHAHAILHEYGFKGNNRAEELVATAMEEIAVSIRRSRSYRGVILHGTGGYRDGS